MHEYVASQATNKKKLELRLYNMSDVLIENLCKIALHYKDKYDDINGWIERISSRLSIASKYETKSFATFEFYEMSLFASFPVSIIDAEAILEDWNDDLAEIGYMKIDEEEIQSMSSNFYTVCSDILSTCINILLSKNHTKDMKFFNKVIRRSFIKNHFHI